MSPSKVTLLGLAALAYAAPQGVTEDIRPDGEPPAGCQLSYDGQFGISVLQPAGKRGLMERQEGGDGTLVLTLQDGILLDGQGRTGYIAANYQFQFDAPAQTGAIYTGGFSVCPDGNLALGSSETWYQCLSGDFYNLYNEDWAEQCRPVVIRVIGSNGGTVDQSPDGQPAAPTTTVSQIGDGQVQVPTSVSEPMVSQIPDGQIQVPSAPVVTQIPDGQIQAPSAPTETAPVTQIPDGQVQAPSAPTESAPVTQIPDGQVQAPSAPTESAPVTQIPDGQVQAPSAPVESAPVTQIPDGQVQAPSAPVEVPTNSTTPSPTLLPPSGSDRIFPSTMIALFVASFGALFVL